MERELLEFFTNDLQGGKLKDLLSYFLTRKDLLLEIRGNYINIYYRGGNLLKVTAHGVGKPYTFEWDKNYAKGIDLDSLKLPSPHVSNENDCRKWIDEIPVLTGYMDKKFLVKPTKERQIQQAIVLGDKLQGYVLTDLEYQKGNHARFDLMGVKTGGSKPMLSFIELKQGYSSLKTNHKVDGVGETAGLRKHLKDILEEIESVDEIEKEIAQAHSLFIQKQDLGLFPCKVFPSNVSSVDIEILFVMTDYQTKGSTRFSINLEEEIKSIRSLLPQFSSPFDIHLNIMFMETEFNGSNVTITRQSNIYSLLNYYKGLHDFYK